MKLCLLEKDKGKKYVSSQIREQIACDAPYSSVSHTARFWACLYADVPVGFDMEESGRRVRPGTVRMLHPLEQQYLAALSAGSREWTEEFLSIWTAKESYMKLTGRGLALGTASFSVIAPDLSYADEVRCEGQPSAKLLRFSPDRRLVACLACACEEAPQEPQIEPVAFAGAAPAKPALEAAAELLAVRDYSRAGLAQKLAAKGYGRQAAEEAAAELAARGYLDDASYAASFARSSFLAGKGVRYVRLKLTQAGVEDDVIAAALAAAEEDGAQDEFSRAWALALRMCGCEAAETASPQELPSLRPPERPDDKRLARVGRRLASQGFEAGVIYRVLGRLRS